MINYFGWFPSQGKKERKKERESQDPFFFLPSQPKYWKFVISKREKSRIDRVNRVLFFIKISFKDFLTGAQSHL